MTIQDNDLLQFNATIIAGIVILLTIASITQESLLHLISTLTQTQATSAQDISATSTLVARIVISLALVPFILSSLLILSIHLKESIAETEKTKIRKRSIGFTMLGLIYLAAIVSVLLFH